MSYSRSEPDVASAPANHAQDVSHIEPDDIGVGLLVVLGALVAVVVLLVAVLLQAWFYNWQGALQARNLQTQDLQAQENGLINGQRTPAAIAQEQLQRIETYGWADDKKRARTIPISRAMELVAKEVAAESAGPPAAGKEKGEK